MNREKEIKKLEKQFGKNLTDTEIENIMSYKDMVADWKLQIKLNKSEFR